MRDYVFLLLLSGLVSAIIAYIGWAAPRYRKKQRRRDYFAPLDSNPWW